MKLGFTHFTPFQFSRFHIIWFLLLLVNLGHFNPAYGQGGCSPISTLSCDNVDVGLPFSLSFSSAVAGTLVDKNGAGTGFTMVDAYSGTRLTADGTPTNSSVRGYEASKLTLSGGRLMIATNKGIAYLSNNNQINTLGVKVDSRGKLKVETTLVNPYNGTSGQQGGLWFGLGDKTFVKLVVTANKVELRREINDVSSTVTGTTNTDQRITAAIANLNTMTVRLRLVVDPVSNTAEGFYSTDGVSYLNAGAAYSTKTLSIAGMGLTSSTAYAGIFATYRNGTTPVSYSFEEFAIQSISASNAAPVFSPASYNFSVGENVALNTIVGSVSASDANGDALSYSIVGGNTNSTFGINTSTGQISVSKFLSYHKQSSFNLTVRVKDAAGLSDDANVAVTINAGPAVPGFNTIGWSSVAPQEFAVNEVQGEAVNGKLYTFGGYYVHPITKNWTPTDRAYIYNPVTNVWARIASMPPMNGTNYGGVTHAGFATDGTDIYFAGGYTSNSTGDGQIFGTNEVWKYIVAENRYVRLPNLPVIIGSGQLEYLNGKLHHIGGHGRTRTSDVGSHYVLELDNLGAGWKTLAPLPNPTNHAGSTVYEGKIYYMGGQHSFDEHSDTQRDMYVYDPANNTWTRLADFPVPSGATGRAHISSAVFVMGNRIFLLGGDIAHTVNCNLVSGYTPATNTWQNLTPLPISIRGGVAATLVGNLYYTGGANSKATFKGIPGGSTATQQVASFTLINADTDQPIQTLTNGSTLNLATLPSRNLNIRANTSPSTVGSVVFALSGAQNKAVTESRAPYALFGDNTAGDYYAWTPAVGTYSLKATPFTASGGTGTAGTPLTVGFTVIDQAATTSILSEDQAISQVRMYPNPSTKTDVHIQVQNIGQFEKVTLWLMDINGNLLEKQHLTTNDKGNASTILSRSRQLKAGVYLIQIQLPVGYLQRRLVVY